MRTRRATSHLVAAAVFSVSVWLPLQLAAQRGGLFMGAADDPAIAYSTGPLSNVVDALNRRLQDGSVTLRFDGRGGYLASALDALKLPVDSQLLVFTPLSLQGRLINPANPRALFFNERVALGWVRGGELLEVAAHDDRSGIVFYTLEQRPAERPVFKREFRCLGCHMSGDTLGVPGLVMFSTTPAPAGGDEKIAAIDQRNPIAERWGGWFVTGGSAAIRHLGNGVPALSPPPPVLPTVDGLFDRDGFRAASSDIAALLAFSHQTHMANLLTRASWEARAADPATHPDVTASAAQEQRFAAMMSGVAEEVVDYMLFIAEAPLPGGAASLSGFAVRMSARGPRDRRGRSLYELDLKTRLLKYPCSYLIYSPAFDALPAAAKAAIYRRMWEVLSGEADGAKYSLRSLADRRAIVEILRDTKPDLPAYFTAVTR